MNYLMMIAFIAGIAIAVQAGLNAQLAQLLNNPLLAAACAFFSSLLYVLVAFLAFTKHYPSIEAIHTVPFYLWFSPGVFSAFAITIFYYLIPKIGMGNMMSLALSGQLLAAMLSTHFGWFELPVKPITWSKGLGIIALVIGVILINQEA